MQITITRVTKGEKFLSAAYEVVEGKNRVSGIASKYPSEKDWFCDAMFDGGDPVFCHGEGSRCCKKIALLPVLVEAIEAKFKEA